MALRTTKSVFGKRIRLTEERWQHILERHPEVVNNKNNVLKTIKNPDIVTKGWTNELVAIRKISNQDLAVIYSEEEAFVITAFFTRSRKYFEKRGIIWNK